MLSTPLRAQQQPPDETPLEVPPGPAEKTSPTEPQTPPGPDEVPPKPPLEPAGNSQRR